MATVRETLDRLKSSSFRSRFHLSLRDKEYVREKGMEEIRTHAERFIRERLAPEVIPNDGRQTPMRGHPVFIAQHATATCCRCCLEKWYRVKKGRALSDPEVERIVNLILAFIEREVT